jgi:hypothetical protein
MRCFALSSLLLLVLLVPVPSAVGGEEEGALPVVEDAWVEEALQAAGENRGELEAAIARFADDPDPRKRVAIRFLVANMPGKGYVVTVLRGADEEAVPYDPTDYPDFKDALAALDDLEKEHGELSFDRDRIVKDVETVSSDDLNRHVEEAFTVWERVPASHRIGFAAFLEYVLPYRGSQEPVDEWLDPLMRRYAAIWKKGDEVDPAAVYKRIAKEAGQRVRFDERYYLHPTDQGYTEMSRSGLGRCEDITNMTTYAARSVGLATAADFTPAWGHRDNNHAWNVLLDAEGRGSDPVGRRAAKVYRKTFSIQRDALAFRLPEGREAPNRFLASKTIRDVTDQYGETSDVTVALDPAVAAEESFAYLCVFNGGEWTAIAWSGIHDGRATFERMGRDLLYLPAIHDGKVLVAAGAPLLVEADGTVVPLEGKAAPAAVTLAAPKEEGPLVLRAWRAGAWEDVRTYAAGESPGETEGLAADGLYWLVAEEGRRLERPFVIRGGKPRWR